ncbi:22620_t:CDS:2, partial [Gigaspora margarita]
YKKIKDKNHQILVQFLDTILYTCGTIFNNVCELSITTPTGPNCEVNKFFDEHSDSEDDNKSLITDNYEINVIDDLHHKEQDKNMINKIDDPI